LGEPRGAFSPDGAAAQTFQRTSALGHLGESGVESLQRCHAVKLKEQKSFNFLSNMSYR
jgi:hypothetical protein